MIGPNTFAHASAYVDEGCKIGLGTKIWHFVHMLMDTVIGGDYSLDQNVMAWPNVTTGGGFKIQNNVSIYKGVTLEQNFFCRPSCVFPNVLTSRVEINRKDEFSKTLVKRGCTSSANATIVCGNTLGQYCMISAGAVVTSDVPDFALMVGIQAKRVGWVNRASDRLGDNLICQRTRERYKIIDKKLSLFRP